MPRRPLPWIVLLAAALHLVGLARSHLPAQDGLKFIRVARQFHHRPWADVVRGSDQHPLYPAAIALMQPPVSALVGPGPDSWRLAAQGVSAIASVALLVPLFGLARVLFGPGVAALACLIYVLLPLPAEVGHDTLNDSLALLAFVVSLDLGQDALRRGAPSAYAGCGLAAGLGYLARPEVLIVPLAVLLAAAAGPIRMCVPSLRRRRDGADGNGSTIAPAGRVATLAVAFLAVVGSYALVKGEVSEKLPLRILSGLKPSAPPRKATPVARAGLDDPRWDFSPKEESGHAPHLSTGEAMTRLASRWVENLGYIFPAFVVWGALRVRTADGGGPAKRLVALYTLLYVAILVRHATLLGYLSGRHTLPIVLASVPWAAAGVWACARRLGGRLPEGWARGLAVAALAALMAVGIGAQLKAPHPSRWGHREAGRWLAEHAGPSDAVLDTRGWAGFAAGRFDAYDYWHVRQALSDARLRYVVVGSDELSAESRRAGTLRALLAYAAEPAAAFPERRGGSGVGVRVFRFHRPDSWEGLRP